MVFPFSSYYRQNQFDKIKVAFALFGAGWLFSVHFLVTARWSLVSSDGSKFRHVHLTAAKN